MRHKILIADDSLTIQKVIKITLANEPFDLEVCASVGELSALVQSYNPNIVLLDFNLSEDQTGYQLCEKIKSLKPDTKVFMLFGTFDTIDEESLQSSSCDNQIVKPFDGTKFINICRSMADEVSSKGSPTDDNEDYEFEMKSSAQSKPVEEDEDDDSGWVMDAPSHEEPEEEISIPEPMVSKKSALEMDVEDWGMSVPSVIDGDDEPDHLEIPEVINFSKKEEVSKKATLPVESDLEYPDMFTSDEEPKLTPLSELNLDDKDETQKVEFEAIPSGVDEIDFNAPKEGTNTEEELKRIQEQIKDEVESKDLWSFDDFEDSDEESSSKTEINEVHDIDDLPLIKPHTLEEISADDEDIHHVKEEFESDFMRQALADFPSDLDYLDDKPKEEKKHAPPASANFVMDAEFEEKLKKQLEPLVEEYVKQYSKSMIEKVAWEVIPDLAENLIKKEIERISQSILNP